jgi:hypothetical protein
MSTMRTKGAALITGASSVDAALAGLDQGEIVTIRSLSDKAEWDRFDAARRPMSGRLSSAVPAVRYDVKHPQSGRV